MRYFDNSWFDGLKSLLVLYMAENYDLCYLSAMHDKNRTEGADTIIVGSSHAMNGLIESQMEEGGWGRTINFSTNSQDIWFDLQHVRKALAEGAGKPGRCIINFGYYMLHQDLSLSMRFRVLLSYIYVHLFGKENMHHYRVDTPVDPLTRLSFDRELFPEDIVRPLLEYWSRAVMLEQSSYYGYIRTRDYEDPMGTRQPKWHTLDDAVKENLAIQRTASHNKLLKYKETREENGKLLREMVGLLHQNGVRVFVVITPYTAWYNRYIDPSYKKDIESCLEELPWPVEYLDMNDYPDAFSDADFRDTDHLNLEGAQHTTAFLNEYLQLITQQSGDAGLTS